MNARQRRKVRRLGARLSRAQALVTVRRNGMFYRGQVIGFWAKHLQARVRFVGAADWVFASPTVHALPVTRLRPVGGR